MQNQCPKCGKSIKKDPNLLSLIFLFGDVNIKNKKAVCDVCGSKINKRK